MRQIQAAGLALALLLLACSDDGADPARHDHFHGYRLAVTDEAVSPEQQAVVQEYEELLDRAERICEEDRATIAAMALRAHEVTSGAMSTFDALTLIDQSVSLDDGPAECRFIIGFAFADADADD